MTSLERQFLLRPSNDVEWCEGKGGGGTGKQQGKEESIWEKGGGVLFLRNHGRFFERWIVDRQNICLKKYMYTRPHYFLCMHVQIKHNV